MPDELRRQTFETLRVNKCPVRGAAQVCNKYPDLSFELLTKPLAEGMNAVAQK